MPNLVTMHTHKNLVAQTCQFLPLLGLGQHLLPGIHFIVKIAWQVWDPISFHEFAMDSLKTLHINYILS